MNRTKIIQTGLRALCERWPSIKTWANLPNDALLEIGLAVIESNEEWGKLVYLSRNVDKMIDEKLQFDESLYYTRTGNGYVHGDGLHAIYGGLESFITIN
jgi:hypothetical protein